MRLASGCISPMGPKPVLLYGGNLAISGNTIMHLSLAQQFNT